MVVNNDANLLTKTQTAKSVIKKSGFSKLVVENIALSFGGKQVLKNVGLELLPGQVGLLTGENGSGKTTLLNVLSGFLKPEAGQAHLIKEGKTIDILKEESDGLPLLGIARLWQDIRLFHTMTALENVLTAAPSIGINPFRAIFQPIKVRQQEKILIKKALNWLDIMGMKERSGSSGDKLSLGQAKRVAIARLLQTGAEVLLLDEPLAGLDQAASLQLVNDLGILAQETGKALLIVEHNQHSIIPIADYKYELVNGVINTTELRNRDDVA